MPRWNAISERVGGFGNPRTRAAFVLPSRPEVTIHLCARAKESLYFGASEGLYDLGLDPFSTRVNGKNDVIGAPVRPGRRHLQIAGEVNRLTGP
jgi:hypothetical protein